MGVLVTTTFSQGAVFYAGETLSCTIAFTNPLPVLPKPPSASSSSSSSYSRRSSTRPQQLHQKQGGHSRSQSLTSASELENNNSSASMKQQQQIEHRPKSISREVEGVPWMTNTHTSKSATTSLTSLASSTLSYFTGYSPKQDVPLQHANVTRKTKWEEPQVVEQSLVIADERQEPISVELEDGDQITPRSSVDTVPSVIRDPYYMDTASSRRSSMDSLASINHPYHSARSSQLSAPRLSQFLLRSSSTPSLVKKTEHLLWGFAQVVGNFSVDPTLINNNEFAPLKRRTMYRPHGTGMGGGGGLLIGKPDRHAKIDTRTTPVLSTPPSILFVDLDLAPGETKKFSYKLKLPNDIPPSHRGRAIRFTYSLVVGTQRASSTPSNGQGHVVQIPFRVLNHVSEDGSRPIYDLMNPIVMYKDEAIVEEFSIEDFKKRKAGFRRNSTRSADKDRSEFMSYVNELLERSNENASVQEITRRQSDTYDEPIADQEDDDEHTAEKRMQGRACAQIVSRITNASRKAMFDICKNNQRVAQLHLTKTAYRLGEPVTGVLDFEHATMSTYQVSILLESTEVVEADIALRQPHHIARISRKCYSEHHSFCLSHQRLAFSLPIPAIASPEFQTTGVKLQYYLKFEFIVTQKPQSPSSSSSSATNTTITTTAPAFIPINVDERHKHYQSAQDVDVSTFDCQIPIRVYGSPGGTDRAVYGRPYTFLVQ